MKLKSTQSNTTRFIVSSFYCGLNFLNNYFKSLDQPVQNGIHYFQNSSETIHSEFKDEKQTNNNKNKTKKKEKLSVNN